MQVTGLLLGNWQEMLGERLSNTSLTYSLIGDNHGKLWIIPSRLWMLECSIAEAERGAAAH